MTLEKKKDETGTERRIERVKIKRSRVELDEEDQYVWDGTKKRKDKKATIKNKAETSRPSPKKKKQDIKPPDLTTRNPLSPGPSKRPKEIKENKIEYDEEDEVELSLPPPNQECLLQRRK